MKNKRHSLPTTIDDPRESIRQLTGNELKLCILYAERYIRSEDLTVNALATELAVSSATIIRLMSRLCDKGFLDIFPTEKAISFTETVRVALSAFYHSTHYKSEQAEGGGRL